MAGEVFGSGAYQGPLPMKNHIDRPRRHSLVRLGSRWLTAVVALVSLAGCDITSADSDAQSNDVKSKKKLPTSCDVRDYGAVGDGVTKDTVAIQAAVDACAGHGGEVHLRAGTYLSGMVELRSAMIFHVHGDATLLGSTDDADYPDTDPPTDNTQLENCKKALLYAEGASDLHVTGTGVIDGQGQLDKWQGSSEDVPEATRPMAMFFVQGNGVSIENVTVKNAAMWGVVDMETDNLTIRDITVDSTHGSTRDGIDIVDCHHVLVDGVTVSSEDDSICLKSGAARGIDDVVVQHSHVLTSGVANALKIGTASYGPVTNVTFDDIEIDHADKAAMAVESVDGSAIENVSFEHITFHDVGTPLFVLIGDRALRPEHTSRRIGSIDGVHFDDVTGDDLRHGWGSIISGLEKNGVTYPVNDVTFHGVSFAARGGATSVPADPPEYAGEYPDPNLWGTTPASGIFVRHATGVGFDQSAITLAMPDVRTLFHLVDVADFAPPMCDVTFVVHGVPIDQVDAVRVLGRTTLPAGLESVAIDDALGAWSAAHGAPLAANESDPSTFTGHASLAQAASLAFKTITVDGGAVHYERAGLGNRTANVPSAIAATIDLTWQD